MSAKPLMLRFVDADEQGAFADLISHVGTQLFDHTVERCDQTVLHLHRFHDNELGTFDHPISYGDLDADHTSGHGGYDCSTSGRMGSFTGSLVISGSRERPGAAAIEHDPLTIDRHDVSAGRRIVQSDDIVNF